MKKRVAFAFVSRYSRNGNQFGVALTSNCSKKIYIHVVQPSNPALMQIIIDISLVAGIDTAVHDRTFWLAELLSTGPGQIRGPGYSSIWRQEISRRYVHVGCVQCTVG